LDGKVKKNLETEEFGDFDEDLKKQNISLGFDGK
jgi:hypothetical protein